MKKTKRNKEFWWFLIVSNVQIKIEEEKVLKINVLEKISI